MAAPRRSPRPPVVLIADDSEDTREMYAEFLRYLGFNVATANDGKAALDKVRSQPPDVLVLDLTMPGLDGWAVATAVKAHAETKAVRIIAVTGHALAGAEAEARKAGVDAFLTKPCLPDDLAAEIGRQLRKRQ